MHFLNAALAAAALHVFMLPAGVLSVPIDAANDEPMSGALQAGMPLDPNMARPPHQPSHSHHPTTRPPPHPLPTAAASANNMDNMYNINGDQAQQAVDLAKAATTNSKIKKRNVDGTGAVAVKVPNQEGTSTGGGEVAIEGIPFVCPVEASHPDAGPAIEGFQGALEGLQERDETGKRPPTCRPPTPEAQATPAGKPGSMRE